MEKPYDATFDEKDVITYHLKREFNKIDRKNNLMNFLPHIESWRNDQAALETWKAHFTAKSIPFAITRHKGERKREKGRKDHTIYTYALWKEQRV